jgi:hypothetical protein
MASAIRSWKGEVDRCVLLPFFLPYFSLICVADIRAASCTKSFFFRGWRKNIEIKSKTG